MDKLSYYLLQKIDTNCNNCGHFIRDIKLTEEKNKNKMIIACKIHYGYCSLRQCIVGEIANICLPYNQSCFKHRLDFLTEEERNKKLGL